MTNAVEPIVIASAVSGIWDGNSSHDVGATINAAITLAAPGATIVLPGGDFYFSTPIVQNRGGVKIKGQGIGNQGGGTSITRLIWNGAAGQSPAFFVGPASGGTPLGSIDLDGFVVDGNQLADVGIKISSVTCSRIYISAWECRKTAIWIATENATGPGTQYNDFWLFARQTNGSYNGTGILIDGAGGWSASPSVGNVSLNRFHYLDARYAGGDGIVVGFADTNKFYDIFAQHTGSAKTGNPVVFANDTYTPPSGVAVAGYTYNNPIFSTGSPVYFAGSTANSTLTANGGNVGSAAYAPVTISTNATTSVNSNVLNFASTTGVGIGLSIKAGGASSGIYPYSLVTGVTGSTVNMTSNGVSGAGSSGGTAVASGQSVTFGYAMTTFAVAGTYTITATGASTYNITAPAGGTSQSGVSVSGGLLSFKDMVLPWTGSAVNGDSWTMVVPQATNRNEVYFIDKANSISDPWFELPSYGWFQSPYSPIPTVAGLLPFGYSSQIVSLYGGSSFGISASRNTSLGPGSVIHGGVGHNIGSGNNNGAIIGGISHTANGFGSAIFGGNQNTVTGSYSAVTGGQQATDRGRYNSTAYAAGKFSAQGDAQIATAVLRATGNSTSAVRLTADGSAAGSANAFNIPNNTAAMVTIDILAYDHTTITKNECWNSWTGLLTRGANAASTALQMNTTPTPITNGTVTGSAIAATADTTNGGINLSFTPPTGNSDTWNIVAKITAVEVQ